MLLRMLLLSGLMLAGLCPVQLAAENLLRNADFSAAGSTGSRDVPSWNVSGGTTVKTLNGKLEIVCKETSPYMRVEQFVPVRPQWATMRFAGKMEIQELEGITHAWFGVFPSIVFLDAQKKELGRIDVDPEAGKTCGVHAFADIFTLPPGTTEIGVRFLVQSARTRAYASELILESLAAPGEPVDATAPPERSIDWGKEPIISHGSDRGEIVLNGLWQFQPVDPRQNRVKPEAVGWGLINVPGTWKKQTRAPGLAMKAGGPLWPASLNLNELSSAWYRRPLTIPADWKNRKIELELERVSTVAQVWFNGVYCGKVQHPGGIIDLTAATTTAGQQGELLIQVLAVSDMTEVMQFEGPAPDQYYKKQVSLEGKGLTGDVVLHSRSASGGYASVFIQPSVRDKKLRMMVEFSGIQKPDDWLITADVLNTNGQIAKQFPTTKIKVNPDIKGNASVPIEFPWENPELWDLDTPNLYDLRLKFVGNGRTEVSLERFGFREFYIEGRNFYINGRRINLRPISLNLYSAAVFSKAEMQGAIDGWRKAGFNIHEAWPVHDVPGMVAYPETVTLDYAAQVGWPAIVGLPSASGIWQTFFQDEAGRNAWRQSCADKIRKYRNNPAILMWVHTPNLFNGVCDQDPRYIGQTTKFFKSGNGVSPVLAMGQALSKTLTELDPTRPNFSHAGQIGNLYTVNSYLGMTPLQEQEEWLSEYVQHGEIPYMAVEFGFIPGFDFRRGRSHYLSANSTEKQMTEHLAAFYGVDAYRKESFAAATENRDNFIKDQQYRGSDTFVPDQLAVDLFARMNSCVYRNWRTAGCAGGMVPWMIKDAFDQGRINLSLRAKYAATVKSDPFVPGQRGFYKSYIPAGDRYILGPDGATPNAAANALVSANSTTLAWLGGAQKKGDPVDFTEKSHNFFSGETIRKQVVLLNDLPQRVAYSYEIKLTVNGVAVAAKTGSGDIDTADRLLLPVEFPLPAVTEKRDAVLSLNARIGSSAHADSFECRIFPSRSAPDATEIALCDSAGITARFMHEAGYNFRQVRDDSGQPPVIVIGRETLKPGKPFPFNLKKYVENGGRLLIMAHDSYGTVFRYGQFVQRQVYAVDSASHITSGLDVADLRDWRGTGTLRPAYPEPVPASKTDWGWHWGNRGSVVSRNIEKPHHGGWTPLFESDFDLQYTPLMKLCFGNGMVVLAQFDFEDNLSDPAALRLFDNLLRYTRTEKLLPRSHKTVYLGDKSWAQLLSSFGCIYRPVDAIPADADLILVGSDASVTSQQLVDATRRGARVLVLGAKAARDILRLPLEKKSNYRGSLQAPFWPEAEGLSASDLRWRSPADAELLKTTSGLEVGADGQLGLLSVSGGKIVVSLLDPNQFNADTFTYFRYTRWRQTRALNQILTNLGADFSVNSAIFDGAADRKDTWRDFADNWRGKMILKLGHATQPLQDPGISREALAAMQPDFDDSKWSVVSMPFVWAEQNDPKWGNENGEAVFRRVLTLPAELAGKDLELNLGAIDDFDMTYFNGVLIGKMGSYQAIRKYVVPGSLVKAGRNVLAIRVFDNFGNGGIVSPANTFRLPGGNESHLGLYHIDYIDNVKIGDHPHRYYRW